ncbi:hypothetical protein IPL68_04110 [Candidatus Saccharibacteria bacterium]|nr:MAG: hypothetical protein IPL68_04110 [Candidatus Saccharibacteria bacterium]
MKQTKFLRAGMFWLSLIVFMSLTRPYTMPVSLLIVPFILFGIALFTSWQAFSGLYYRKKTGKHENGRVNLLGGIVSIILVFALGLESLGELTPKDFLVILLFGAVAYFYMVRSVK